MQGIGEAFQGRIGSKGYPLNERVIFYALKVMYVFLLWREIRVFFVI